jgi:hypothetical protein
LLAPGLAGFLQHIGQRGLLLAFGGGAFALLRRMFLLGHLQAHLPCQILHRFDEVHAGVVHQKADGVAVLAAAEAVIELLGRAHAELGDFSHGKGHSPMKLAPPFLSCT